MADQILFNVAANVITNLGSYAVQQIGLALGAEKELRKLEITMSTLKNVLLDAEEQQVTNRAVREWLQRLKEIVYEVDNLVDEFAYEALRRQVEIHGSKRREVHNFFSHTNPFVFGYNMGQKTKDVRERLDEIVADAKIFDFAIKVVEKHVQSRRRQETYSFVRSTEVVGRESDQEAIIQILKSSSDEERVHVIPILGMGGLGKTTLAQSVYNDNWVASEFSQRIWVHVSQDFDIRGIVIKILKEDRFEVFGMIVVARVVLQIPVIDPLASLGWKVSKLIRNCYCLIEYDTVYSVRHSW